MTSGPNHNEDPDTRESAVPPYEGRRKSADVDDAEEATKDGAATGGATGPVESDGDVDDAAHTERGEHASPADEQPASESTTTDDDPDATGPSHEPGTGRAEDKP
jgi:hypothetical protein